MFAEVIIKIKVACFFWDDVVRKRNVEHFKPVTCNLPPLKKVVTSTDMQGLKCNFKAVRTVKIPGTLQKSVDPFQFCSGPLYF